MINLIKNEYIKVFSKKAIYVTALVTLGFVLLANFALNQIQTKDVHYRLEKNAYANEIANAKTNIKHFEEAGKKLNEDYYYSKAILEFDKLVTKYGKQSWQAYVLADGYFDEALSPSLIMTLMPESEENPRAAILSAKAQYEKQVALLDGDWKNFYQKSNEILEETKALLDKTEAKALQVKIDTNKMLIENNIMPRQNYLNVAAKSYVNDSQTLIRATTPNIKAGFKMNEAEKKQLEKNSAINKYIIENKVDANNMMNNYGTVKSLSSNYGIFFLIMIIVVAGSIVSDEMSKGTIKLLLIKPYERWKILLSKYLVSFSFVLIVFFVILMMQAIVGGLFGDFASLSNEVVNYDFATKEIVTSNLFTYTFANYLYEAPQYILLMTLAFAISTIFGSTSVAMVLGIGGNIAAGILNMIVTIVPKKIFMILPTVNWNLSAYRFGGVSQYFKELNFTNSLLICLAYWLIMIVVAFIVFNKKDIKNI